MHRDRVATRVAFFIAGFGMAAWAPLVPFAKDRAQLNDASLGLLLLCVGVGSLIMMPITGFLTGRYGCRAVIIAAAAVISIALPMAATAGSASLLGVALLLLGASVGTMDVAMNIQAVIVEKASGEPLMSGFHGLYSVGGIAGAGGVSAFLSLGGSPLVAVLSVVALIILLVMLAGRDLLGYGSERDGPAFVLPHGPVIFIGVLCFITFLAEGALLDWSALFLTAVRDLEPARAGLGYAAFAVAMTIGRLTGDRVVAALGRRKILLFGGLLAAAGFFVAILIPSWVGALAGFVIIGLGASNIVPVLFTAAGAQTRMPPNLAVAAITTLGYAGILVGPAAIGFISESVGLKTAFAMVGLSLLLVAASARIAPARTPVAAASSR